MSLRKVSTQDELVAIAKFQCTRAHVANPGSVIKTSAHTAVDI
jgi:hypothetical protein